MAKPDNSLSHFDADALAAAHEEPTIQVDRFVYRGRLLSVLEWLPFWERLQALEAKAVAEHADAAVARLRERQAFHADYLRAVFPKRDFRFWAPDPVAHILKKPLDDVDRIVGFFFTLQARATFGADAIARTASTPDGTESTHSTTPLVGVASE